jgi:hypothetical protein
VTVIILIIFYTAPLSVLAEVLSTRSSATLYLPFAVMNLVRALDHDCRAAALYLGRCVSSSDRRCTSCSGMHLSASLVGIVEPATHGKQRQRAAGP